MKTILISFILLLSNIFMFAQDAKFISTGTIEFDRTVNTHALIKRELSIINPTSSSYVMMEKIFDQYKATKPQFKTVKSSLSFADDKTFFTPVASTIPMDQFTSAPEVMQRNEVYTDLTAGNSITQKNVAPDVYLVKDSIRKINWKITSETKEIAGYFCRRANAVIMDSLYVVAFYTDEIPVSGGPESFSGLPGMILQVTLPHDNVTWLATKVTASAMPSANLKPSAPAKAKVVNNKELRVAIEPIFKPRPKFPTIIKYLML